MPLSTGGGWPDPVQEGRGGGGGRHRGWWMQEGEESRNTAGEGEAAESSASASAVFFCGEGHTNEIFFILEMNPRNIFFQICLF
jgi:hypothetical protein